MHGSSDRSSTHVRGQLVVLGQQEAEAGLQHCLAQPNQRLHSTRVPQFQAAVLCPSLELVLSIHAADAACS